MLVVFPFHAGDCDPLHNLLTWIGQVRAGKQWKERPPGTLYPRHKALLIADAAVDWSTARKLHSLAEFIFPGAQLITTENAVTGCPQGANALFARACNHITSEPWLWFEADAVPLHHDWLDIIADEYAACGNPFMGCIYPCTQPNLPSKLLSGIAVYPAMQEGRAALLRGLDDTIAFDVAMTTHVLPLASHTIRIQHLWGEPNLPPTFPKPGDAIPRNAFTLAKLQHNAVVFHRNKDGTLIERLRERNGLAKPAPPSRGMMKVRRTASLGDVLSSTVVAKKLMELGYDVEFHAHPSTHCILRRVSPGIKHICEAPGTVEIDLDGVYERHPNRKKFHFAQMFVDHANQSLRAQVIPDSRNFAPRMVLEPNDAPAALEVMGKYPRPWTLICPRSNSWLNRTVPDEIWSRAAAQIEGTKFWLGLHPAPGRDGRAAPSAAEGGSGIIDLHCRHFDRAIGFLGVADLLVTVDTGPMHVAAALGTPVVTIQQASSPELHLSDQQDFLMISPSLHCLNCQLDLCPIHAHAPPCQQIDPGLIARAANARLLCKTADGVSAVVCCWKPRPEKLNRCLASVVDQVQEVIVASDNAGMIPRGAMQHGKIRYVKHPQGNLGYGRTANYGIRHSNHKYLLLLNDDCYLNPDVVAILKEQMTDGVGMVAHELRYPDGTIQHGGTYRPLGANGWGHLDHRARESRIKHPVEMENVCGASVLVRREAFYQAGAFDEDFFLYCEDNHLCLAIRQAGWKIIYTPHAVAIHEESQSTSLVQNMHIVQMQSQATLMRKWGWWFELNRNNPGLGIFE